MGIPSGSGTSADPYVVHDWDELVYSMRGNCVELANDIEAPSGVTSLSSSSLYSLDGKNYAIRNLTVSPAGDTPAIYFERSGTSGSSTVKNISFINIYCQSNGAFIGIRHKGDYNNQNYDNVSFSGIFNGGTLIRAMQGDMYGGAVNIRIATNIEIINSNFSLLDNSYDGRRGTFTNSNIMLKYVNCSPTRKLCRLKASDTGIGSFTNCLLNFSLEQANNSLDIGSSINTCAIIGKGNGANGIIIASGSGTSVIENTLPVTTSLTNMYSLSTADMKNAQTLHDLGFPIGVD